MTKFGLKILAFPFLKFFIIWSFSLVIYSELLSLLELYTKKYFIYFWIFTTFLFFFLLKNNKKKSSLNSFFNLIPKTYIYTSIFLLLLLFLCLIYPPNNYDSMTYHLPRVFYWIQNESLNNFASNNLRQLVYAPFSGMVFSALFCLTNSDYLFNFVHFFCLIVILFVLKNIISELNPKLKATSTAFIFLLTMPMVILQATTTQNDLLTSMWLLLCLMFAIKFKKNNDNANIIFFSISLGCAILTKSTAYIFGFPIYILAMFTSYKYKKLNFFLISNLIIVLLNTGTYFRNFELTGNPIGLIENIKVSNEDYSLQTTFSNFLRNSSSQLILPDKSINNNNEKMVKDIHDFFNIDYNNPETTFGNTKFDDIWFVISEDMSGNPLHYLIILFCILMATFNKKNSYIKNYIVLILFSFILFCTLIKWQPWINRLNLPFFILITPFVALIIHGFDFRVKIILFASLFVYSLPFLLMNPNRPIIKYSYETNISSLKDLDKINLKLINPVNIVSNREQFFSNDKNKFKKYANLVETIKNSDCKIIGIDLGSDTPEYWLLYLLNIKEKSYSYNIYHTNVNNLSKKYEKNFKFQCKIDKNLNLKFL